MKLEVLAMALNSIVNRTLALSWVNMLSRAHKFVPYKSTSKSKIFSQDQWNSLNNLQTVNGMKIYLKNFNYKFSL